MDRDFHYYGTLLAAACAGFNPDAARSIGTSAQFIDDCTEDLTHTGGIFSMGSRARQFNVAMGDGTTYPFFPLITSVYGVKTWAPTSDDDETRQIWMPFHFLPGNFPGQRSKLVTRRAGGDAQNDLVNDSAESIQLLCRPRSDSAQNMINFTRKAFAQIQAADLELALMLVGCAMHVFADTYAHQDFAGTASSVLNGLKKSTVDCPDLFTVYGHWNGAEWTPAKGSFRRIQWPLDVASEDWLNVYPPPIMRTSALGHGQMGHMPDCSSIAYKYQPAWSNTSIDRNNPQQYMDAFIDMTLALKCIFNNVPFDWNNAKMRESHLQDLMRGRAFPVIQQLFCPDQKSDTEIRMYERGLCIPASDWFLKSEERWGAALGQLLASVNPDPVPGYNEAKFDWPQQVLRWQTESVPLDEFKSSKFFKWNIAAKLLFRANYGQLRGLSNGIARIIRGAQLSTAMDPRQSVIDEFSRYWRPQDTTSQELNDALVCTTSSDEMDSVLLGHYSRADGDTTITPKWVVLQLGDRHFSFSATSRFSSGAVREAFTATVSADRARAQPVMLVSLPPEEGVYLRTFENRVGSNLFLEYPESLVSKIIWFNTYNGTENQRWKQRFNPEDKTQCSFESMRYAGWYLAVDGDNVKAVNAEVFWQLNPYLLDPVISVPVGVAPVDNGGSHHL
jgi:hypothetical protein